jgi:hypothetical protein
MSWIIFYYISKGLEDFNKASHPFVIASTNGSLLVARFDSKE